MGEPLDILDALANAALPLWEVPEGARARLVNLSENATYLVEGPGGWRSVLRVHREAYHSRRAIDCELAWSADLRSWRRFRLDGVQTREVSPHFGNLPFAT